jgi:molybdopterin biosynthesis enzyme
VFAALPDTAEDHSHLHTALAMTASQYKMISIPEAQGTVLQHVKPLGVEQVQLVDALGRTLAADVTANEPLPPFPASIKARLASVKQPSGAQACLEKGHFITHLSFAGRVRGGIVRWPRRIPCRGRGSDWRHWRP